jgi:hypothetical protein
MNATAKNLTMILALSTWRIIILNGGLGAAAATAARPVLHTTTLSNAHANRTYNSHGSSTSISERGHDRSRFGIILEPAPIDALGAETQEQRRESEREAHERE